MKNLTTRSIASALLLIVTLALLSNARAQNLSRTEFLNTVYDISPSEAIDSPMGVILVERFAKAMEESAQAACLAERGLTSEHFIVAAKALLVGSLNGTLAHLQESLDTEKAQEKFKKLAGTNVFTEQKKLESDPIVSAFVTIGRTEQKTKVALLAIENLERGMLVRRHQLVRRTDPYATNDAKTLALYEKHESVVEQFETKHQKHKALRRYLKLADHLHAAMSSSMIEEKVLNWGPGHLEPMFSPLLREHCVFVKPR